MAECNIDKSCFDDVKMCVKVNSVNGIKPNADGEVDIDEKFVTTNTKQTIHGPKTFTNTIKTNGMNTEAMLTTMNGLKIDTAPTVINKSSIKWNDKEQNEVSSIEVTRPANTKDTCISLSANTITEWGSNEKASVEVHAKAGATSYATAPTPSSNATGNEIVTAKWVIDKGLADDTNVVHKTGDEYIHGTKIFSGIIHRYADLTTSGGEQVYRFDDTNANGCGHIYNNVHWNNNAVFNRHGAYNAKSGKSMEIDITSNDAGVGMAYVAGTARKGNLETVTSEIGHTGIATMGWVNNPATSTNVVHRSGDETIAGNKTFSNQISFPSEYFITTDTNDNSLRIVRHGTGHGNNYKIIIQGDTGKIFAPNGFIGNLQGNVYSNEINTDIIGTKYIQHYGDNGFLSTLTLPKHSGKVALQERTRANAEPVNRTLLYECAGGLDKGDITLNDMYIKYNALVIVYSNDDGDYMSTYYLDCAELDIRRDEAGSGTFLLVDGHSYWACTGASTGTKFVHDTNNGLRIHKIYGLAEFY